jgi:hypothetical protein
MLDIELPTCQRRTGLAECSAGATTSVSAGREYRQSVSERYRTGVLVIHMEA